MADQTHPNALGNALIAGQMYQTLQELSTPLSVVDQESVNTELNNRDSVIFRNNNNSTTAFQIQGYGGAGTANPMVVDVDTTNQRLGIRTSGPAYALDIQFAGNDGINVQSDNTSQYAVIQAGRVSAGEVQLAVAAAANQFLTGTAAGDTALRSKSGNIYLGSSGNGDGLVVRNQYDNTTAFQIQNAAGTSNLFVADTADSKVGIGATPSSSLGELQVGASGSTTSASGLTFGQDSVANLYRSGAGALTTNGSLAVDNTLFIDNSGAGSTISSLLGLGNNSGGPYASFIFQGSSTYASWGGAHSLNIDNNDGGPIAFSSNTAGSSGASLLTLSNSGAVTFRNATNSNTAFQVQSASAEPIFNIDTTTTNLLTNPGFETGATGWSGSGTGASCAQNTATTNRIYFGVASLECTLATSGTTTATVNSFTSTLAAGTYTISFHAMSDAAVTLGSTVTFTGGGGTCTLNNTSVTSTGFQLYSCTVTTTGTTTSISFTTTTTGTNLYIDSVQLKSGSTVTPYQIGAVQLRGVVDNPVAFQDFSNSTTALQVLNSSSVGILTVDSYNSLVQIGSVSSNANPIFLGLNNYNATADPTAVGNGEMYYNASTNSFRCRLNGAWQSCGPQQAKVTSDYTMSSTTAANITGLTFSLTASTDYRLTCDLVYQMSSTSWAARFGLNGPASPTLVAGMVTEYTSTGAVTPTFVGFNAYGAVTGPSATTATATSYPVHLDATIRNGTNAGTLAAQTSSSSSTATVTVKAGSSCLLTQL